MHEGRFINFFSGGSSSASGGSGPEPTYEGPGDLKASALGWWGLRAYSAAMIGNNAIRLRRGDDDTEQDFVTLEDGSLDVASIATFKGAATIFVHTIYDQSGNGRDLLTIAAARQPAFILSGLGALPVIRFTAATVHFLTAATTINQSQPMTFSGVAKATASAEQQVLLRVGEHVIMGFSTGDDEALLYAGSNDFAPAADDAFHTLIGVFNGASSHLYVDGADNIINPGTGGTGANSVIDLGSLAGASQHFGGDFTEIGVWGSAFSGADATAMDANQATYWGI